MAAGVVTGATNTILIGFVNNALDYPAGAPSKLIWGFAGICLLLPLSRVCAQILLTYLTQLIVFDLRINLSRQVLLAPLRRLEEHGANKLLATLTNDVNAISGALTNIPFFCMNIAIVLSGLGYLFYLYWPAGLAVLLAMIVGVSLYARVNALARRHFNRARKEQDALFKHFGAMTQGAKELKLHQKRRMIFLKELLAETGQSYRRSNVKGNAYFAGAGSLGQFFFFAVMGMLVFSLPYLAPGVDPHVSRGYAMVLLYLTLPLDALTQVVPFFSIGLISLEKVESLGLSLKNAAEETEPAKRATTDWRLLECRNIAYSYRLEHEDREFTLGPLNLNFQPGELVFIIGGNGSGKTSLAKIILGLYQPDQGEIRFNGNPVTEDNLESYRQHFTAVFSDFYLFESLIGIEQPKIDEKATEYLERLLLQHKVRVENGRLSTLDLSQGQRKRLALLTAYLEDRPIYLFDEWAADQDPLFKEVFYKTMLPELKKHGKTVIVISHDDQYYAQADRIIKLNYGQVASDVVTAPPIA